MRKAYDIFLRHLQANQPDGGFVSLSDYLECMNSNGLEITSGGLVVDGNFIVTFNAHSSDSVLPDVLQLMKNYSIAGYTDNTVDRHEINLFNPAAGQEDEEYIDSCGNQHNAKWIDESDREIGVYRVIDLDDRSEIIHVMNNNMSVKVYPDYEKELGHLDDWQNPKAFDEDYGSFGDYIGDDWLGLCNEIEDNLIFDVYKDIRKILQGFMILKFSSTVYTLDDGIGMSYYVLCGYNEVCNHGEGLILQDFDY